MKIELELDNAIATMVAVSKGWTAEIEDTTQAMVGDSYPTIVNPVTCEVFLSFLIPQFMSEFILKNGRDIILADLTSISNSALDKVKQGDFDSMILTGDFEGIKEIVKANL